MPTHEKDEKVTERKEPKSRAATQERTQTIMVVDDYDDARVMLTKWLEKRGYRVLSVGNGAEGVHVAVHEHPDLILMDLDLPVLDGVNAALLLRDHEELRDVPIVAMTAYAKGYPRAEALRKGCDEFLDKPLDLNRLDEVLSRLLGSGRKTVM